MSEYTENAEKFLQSHNLEFRAVLIGADCPRFCTDAEKGIDMDKVDTFPRKTHIHGKHYRCTVSGHGRGHLTVDFWNSYADEEYNYLRVNLHNPSIPYSAYKRAGMANSYDRLVGPKKRHVAAYDLLACLTKNDPGTFENFCSEYGYDTDSRKAEEMYRVVLKEWRKVQKFFTESEIAELQEIN